MPTAEAQQQETTSELRSVRRFEVRTRPQFEDARAASLIREAASIGVAIASAHVARIYLIEAALDDEQAARVASSLLANPVLETVTPDAASAPADCVTIEVHPLPGVMDPAAQTVVDSVRILLGQDVNGPVQASTGWRYDLAGVTPDQARALAERLLANTVIHAVHDAPWRPDELPHGSSYEPVLTHIPIRDLDDDALTRMSRDAHLFLSLEEMRAVRDEYRELGREPTDIELETIAQTWSEHCVHKTLKSRVTYRGPANDRIDWSGRPGHTVQPDGSVVIENLLKSTVAAATFELIADGIDWTLSVFKDNAGIVAFDDDHAVCIKVETHNHPSAIEPYGGAATGIGGCMRDILGTGLAARPIANTDVFCVAHPDSFTPDTLPAGCLHPRRILKQVVAGVRDYGNRVGVPTLSGAVWFDDRYVGNPLVYCGCIGVMPRDRVDGDARPGDRIIALGGRTGRDGIHGATFSSAELTDTHADEFSHAVQIGNAIEEKKVIDAILRARDIEGGPLFTAITDCGAGGFSSAIGEMGAEIGAEVQLDRAPLKYAGLTYTEIWISEAQERMVLAVPPDNVPELRRICAEESVEMADLGVFGAEHQDLILYYNDLEVGRLPMTFLHEGIPTPLRDATWKPAKAPDKRLRTASVADRLQELLAHPNIASKHWIVNQYDHEVQGATVVKPLVGPDGAGPGDASVIEPVPGSGKGLAISQGLATEVGDPQQGGDPYLMALAAIDECVRNLVCVGADPARIAILDNFCWPACAKPENLGSLVRAAEGCYDAAKAYRTPFVSGKDSLNNQFTTEDGRTIEIPPTLLITGMGIVDSIDHCVTMDAKQPGNVLLLVGPDPGDDARVTDLNAGPKTARAVHKTIKAGLVRAAHDCSEGGWLVAATEMAIAASTADAPIGLDLDADIADCFVEAPSRYLLEVAPGDVSKLTKRLGDTPSRSLGRITDTGRLVIASSSVDLAIADLRAAWRAPLDW